MRIWSSRQARLAGWMPPVLGRFATLKYEEFAAAPREQISALAALCQLLGLDAAFTSSDSVTRSWNGQHLFPPAYETVLAERKEKVRIEPAESWKTLQHRPLNRLARLATWPLGKETYPERL